MLEEILRKYEKQADAIGKWKKEDGINVNELAFKYVEHENDEDALGYFSALMCRYWGQTVWFWNLNKRHISFDRCYDMLYDTLIYVLNKRVWENPDSSIYQDPSGPDKAFHTARYKTQYCVMVSENAQKRKANFATVSRDALMEECKDATDGFLFGIDNSENNYHIDSIIEQLFKNEKTLDGIIVHTVCFNMRIDDKHPFSINRTIDALRELETTDIALYEKYHLSADAFNGVLMEIKNYSSKQLTWRIKAALYKIKEEWYNND